jgi:hypothetical protein
MRGRRPRGVADKKREGRGSPGLWQKADIGGYVKLTTRFSIPAFIWRRAAVPFGENRSSKRHTWPIEGGSGPILRLRRLADRHGREAVRDYGGGTRAKQTVPA